MPGWPVVVLSGEIGFETREWLGKCLHEIVAARNPANVIVNLNGPEFYGAAVLVAADRQAGQRSGGLRLRERTGRRGRARLPVDGRHR
ncbi:hypothetical protein ABZ380_27735, partial [Streptomyces sp. NPDC005901]|uniref:hypothetical protein n=1 Tax=Streptomyces sp. NPDC005901 TaxID=3157171 RepID=UPI003402EF65